jgi:hypothetical protein
MPFRNACLAILLLLATLPAHAAETAAEIPACPLLSGDAIAEVFGKPVTAAEQPPSGGGPGAGRMTTCIWTPADGGLGATVSLIVWSWPPGHPGAAGYVEAFRASGYPDRAPPETVAIGDDALWDGDRLHVRKGDVSFTLATSLNALDATPDARPRLEALGAEVASRLP